MLLYSLSCSIGQDGLSWEAGGGAMEVAGHGNDRPCSALFRSKFRETYRKCLLSYRMCTRVDLAAYGQSF
jgi:hypothetical protein